MTLMGIGLNFIYAVIGMGLGLFGMKFGYNMLGKLTDFVTSNQL